MRTEFALRRCCAAAFLLPVDASAHSFAVSYTLPIPFWLYAWGAAAALIASFMVVGAFASGHTAGHPGAAARQPAYRWRLPAWLLRGAQAISLFGLLFCVVTGWFGTASPYGNFNMTFFWVVFVLGFAYLSALIGDLYGLVNPWRVLSGLLSRVLPSFERSRVPYPPRLGYWPAIALYMGFIGFELLGKSTPFSLATTLALYTLLNLAAVFTVGARAWFRYGEFFSVLLRQFARLAPVEFEDVDGVIMARLRWPLSGLLGNRDAEHGSLLLFVLFMLSSTAFDGLHQAVVWARWFWVDFYQAALSGWLGSNPIAAFPTLMVIYKYWQAAWLLLSPFLYLLMYLAGISLVHWAGGRRSSVRELALRFMPSLLPIVLVYHITHYYTLIQTQGVKIIALASDPFGRGHNWFGTADWFRGSSVPDMSLVWHVQVLLIVLGHIASVYIAHVEALHTYGDRRRALLSQLPMLALMVLFTTVGLWILSQPIKPGA